MWRSALSLFLSDPNSGFHSLKKTGKQATVVGIIQAVTASVFVDSALLLLHLAIPEKLPLSAALILGAVALCHRARHDPDGGAAV